EGRLETREQVAEQARRMVGDTRAKAKLLDFFHRWLTVEGAPELAKNPERYPDFDEAVVAHLRSSPDLFLDDVAPGDHRAHLRLLLLDDGLFLNGRRADFYGADLPEDAPFSRVDDDDDLGERAGVLSHPYLLANFAYTEASSPIHRGVFLARSVLGQRL